MGRRKKEQGRAKKRTREAVAEIVEGKAEEIETQHVTKKTDDELFVLDHTANAVPGGVISLHKERKRQKKGLSHVDQEKVQQLLEQHSATELQKMVNTSKHHIKNAKKQRRTLGSVKPKFDLWNEEASDKKKEKQIVNPGIGMSLAGTASAHMKLKPKPAMALQKYKTVAVEVAESGQSYRPDQEQHQNIIGEALAMELRRNEVEDYNMQPLSSGMSERTKELLLGSSDEESDDDDEELPDNDTFTGTVKNKKLTITQRNKQKRHRDLMKEIRDRKEDKKFVNSIAGIKKMKKEMRKKEEVSKERKTAIEQLKKRLPAHAG